MSERNLGEWVIEVLSSKGYQQDECIDITASTAEVVSIIKSQLNENISEIEAENGAAKQQIAEQYERINVLSGQINVLSGQKAELGNQLEAALSSKNDLENELAQFKSGVAMLASQIAAELIAPHVQMCWNISSLSPLALEASVTVAFSLTKDGKPFGSTIILESSEAGTDEGAQEVFESARRAIIRCGFKGFPMPESAGNFTNVSINFDAKLMKVSW